MECGIDKSERKREERGRRTGRERGERTEERGKRTEERGQRTRKEQEENGEKAGKERKAGRLGEMRKEQHKRKMSNANIHTRKVRQRSNFPDTTETNKGTGRERAKRTGR